MQPLTVLQYARFALKIFWTTVKKNIRRILQNIPEKNTKDVLEEIILILEKLNGEKTHLATKDDIKQVKDDIRDDIKQMIEMMNARFEAMEKANAARFEAMDKRFEAMEKSNAARFEAIDKRFEAMEKANAARFEAINQRYEAIDKRFEAMEKANIARFEAINHRLEKRLIFMQWLISGGTIGSFLGLIGIIIKIFSMH
jgi:chromosome segregation ATPase